MIPLLKLSRTKFFSILIASVCCLLACIASVRSAQTSFLDKQVKNMTAELSELKMKTVCVGRFLIDVPADADISYRGAVIAGWSILSYDDETDPQFAARLQAKETALEGKINENGMRSLEAVQQVNQNGVQGKILMFDRRWIRGKEGQTPAQTISIEAKVRVQNHSFDLTAPYTPDNLLSELAELVTHLRMRRDDEIPTAPGYCFDGGFITDPFPAKPGERTTMFVSLKGHSDVSIVLDMIAGITTPKTLLERDDKNPVHQEYGSRFHTFRRGQRTVDGNPGAEILRRVHEMDGSYGHQFMWEITQNNKENFLTPLMSFEMSTGHGAHGTTVNASFTDAQAIALWETLLSTLRVRPVQQAKPVAAVPQQVPLGTVAYANERCPETGWWECNDGDKDTTILAGRQQYYRNGEGMGQAIQLMPTTPVQRLLGQQPTFTSKVPSMWKLVSRRQYKRLASTVALVDAPPAPVDDATNNTASGADHDESMTPPGSIADSGMICPASGWWRCIEGNALDGTRWFGRGQNLPMATVRQQLSTLEKLKGTPDLVPRKTPWQLIRHDSGATNSSADTATPDDDGSTPA